LFRKGYGWDGMREVLGYMLHWKSYPGAIKILTDVRGSEHWLMSLMDWK